MILCNSTLTGVKKKKAERPNIGHSACAVALYLVVYCVSLTEPIVVYFRQFFLAVPFHPSESFTNYEIGCLHAVGFRLIVESGVMVYGHFKPIKNVV